MQTRVVILEANRLASAGLEQFLTRQGMDAGHLRFFRDFQHYDTFLQSAGYPPHTLIVSDSCLRLSELSEWVTRTLPHAPGLSVVAMSEDFTLTQAQIALASGICGLIDRRDDLEDALGVVLQLPLNAGYFLSPRVSAMISARMALVERLNLNRTDIDFLHSLARGLHNHEIATATGLSLRSMYRVRQRLKQVLGVRTNEQILDAARKQGLLDNY